MVCPMRYIRMNIASGCEEVHPATALPPARFVGLLVGTVVIVGGLTFLPALALGPVAEHLALQAGMTY